MLESTLRKSSVVDESTALQPYAVTRCDEKLTRNYTTSINTIRDSVTDELSRILCRFI